MERVVIPSIFVTDTNGQITLLHVCAPSENDDLAENLVSHDSEGNSSAVGQESLSCQFAKFCSCFLLLAITLVLVYLALLYLNSSLSHTAFSYLCIVNGEPRPVFPRFFSQRLFLPQNFEPLNYLNLLYSF